MEETLITQTTTQAGQKKKKAVKYINPSTTNEQLKGFAQQIVALTTDNFDGASVTSYRTKGEVVFTDKPTPNLVIGSWSATDSIYTAPITYDGDGALSVNVGSISNGSLIVADEDGIFSGVLTASAGESYAPAVASFSFNTDTVTVQGGGGSSSIPDSIVTALGSQFVPTVDNATDFISYADGNIQFFDNRLRDILFDPPDYSAELKQEETFLWGGVELKLGYDASTSVNYVKAINAVGGATINTLSIGNNNATLTIAPALIKLTETAAVIYRRPEGSNRLVGKSDLVPVQVSGDQAALGTVVTICGADSTLSSGSRDKVLTFRRGILNRAALFAIHCNQTLNASGEFTRQQYWYKNFDCDGKSGAITKSEDVGLGVWTSTGKTSSVDSCSFVDSFCPALTFDGDTVTVAKGETARPSPILFFEQRIRNSSGTYTTGGDVAVFNAGYKGGLASKSQLTTISGGVASTVNPWILDDDNVLLGVYPDKEHANAYAITYKPGSYSKAYWIFDAFTVWSINFLNSKFTKTTKTIPQILGVRLFKPTLPNLKFISPTNYDTPKNFCVCDDYTSTAILNLSFLGERNNRKITIDGCIPLMKTSYKSYTCAISLERYDKYTNTTRLTICGTVTYSAKVSSTPTTGSYNRSIKVTISADEEYKAQTAIVYIDSYYDFISMKKVLT